MKITIDVPDVQAEDHMCVAQVLYAVGSFYENKDEEEKVASSTEQAFIPIDDWQAKVWIDLNIE